MVMTHQAFILSDTDTQRVEVVLAEGMRHYEEAYRAFLEQYPQFKETLALDTLREQEYNRLDQTRQIYLDYTGGGLYAKSQLKQHTEMLLKGVYGNPHSSNPTSLASTMLDDEARQYVLSFFNADPEEYMVIFTPNASGALRLVGESYPFEDNGQYLLTFDNHNSVNGIREFAYHKNAPVIYTPVVPPDMRIDADALLANLDKAIPNGNNLFAYPAQSNFSGVQHSLEWVEIAQAKGWDVILDSAAFAPTNRLDLSVVKADFIPLSFYKIFGYPTGIGALIARRSTVEKLRRPWFAGGTITVASVQGNAHFMAEDFAAFEDGTVDYLNLPAVKIGLEHIQKANIEVIHERVTMLTDYLLKQLTSLKHDNGSTLIKVYGPVTTEARGGTIAFNFYDPDNIIFDFQIIEGLASAANISLRTGCFCNPGAGELALNITKVEIDACFADKDRMTFEQFAIAMTSTGNNQEVGAVRISVGIATNFKDVYTFVQFARSFLNVKSQGLLFSADSA
ncbi:MAG: aminotransferase class V-fold PLP-dependent enzyme [Chloroflexi bacterium]|nr:MAG: aminotransferase class V-fold PLP-dependent enzyme [Chloroflexota bacterium]